MRFIVLDSSVQVIEQFFFSHESFNMQRHLFFTSVILFSSMFSKSRFPHVIFLLTDEVLFSPSIPDNM